MNRFQDKNVVITGGTSGIGLATAKRVVAEGGRALVTGRDPERLAAVGQLDGITAIANDASEPAAVEALRAAVDEVFDGHVDAMFLNAGLGAFQPIQLLQADEFERQFGINVRGPLLQLRALEETVVDGGSIVLNTSVVNDLGMPGSGIYAATKGAVRSAMKVFATELAGRQVRVNAVSPGPIDTGFFTTERSRRNAS